MKLKISKKELYSHIQRLEFMINDYVMRIEDLENLTEDLPELRAAVFFAPKKRKTKPYGITNEEI